MRLAPLAVAEASAWEASSPVGPEPSFPPAPAPANPATARRGPGPFPSGPPTDPELEAPGAQLAYVATMTIRMTMAGSSASGPTRTRAPMAARRLNRRADVTRCPPVVDLIDWPVATRIRGESLPGFTSSWRGATIDVVRCVGCRRPRTRCNPTDALSNTVSWRGTVRWRIAGAARSPRSACEWTVRRSRYRAGGLYLTRPRPLCGPQRLGAP